MEAEDKTIAVVGAGIAGLVAAYELSKKNIPVVVFEKNAYAGGRMKTTHSRGLAFDSGADFFADNYTLLKSYAVELDISWVPTEPGGAHRVMKKGLPHRFDLNGPLGVLRLSALSPIARLRFLFWLASIHFSSFEPSFFDLSRLPKSLDSTDAASYLNKKVGREITDYIADPFTGIMQFHRADEISVAALFALIKMMLSPKYRFSIRYTPGGIDEIPTALAKKVPVIYNTTVTEIVRRPSGGISITRDGIHEDYAAVIVAAPAYAAADMLYYSAVDEKRFLASVRYAATITVAYEIPSDLFPDRTHLTYVPYVENRTVSGYANEGRKGIALNGRALLNVYLHENAARELMKKDDAHIAAAVLKELANVCPEARRRLAEIRPHAIERWPYAMPKFAHKYLSAARAFLEYHQGRGYIYYAGDYLNAPWMEGAARSGKRAALHLAAKLFGL